VALPARSCGLPGYLAPGQGVWTHRRARVHGGRALLHSFTDREVGLIFVVGVMKILAAVATIILILGAGYTVLHVRRPYFLERLALEASCPFGPTGQMALDRALYSRFGVILNEAPAPGVGACEAGRHVDHDECILDGSHWVSPGHSCQDGWHGDAFGKCTKDGTHVVNEAGETCPDGWHYIGGHQCARHKAPE
jgi:hypothetical protein